MSRVLTDGGLPGDLDKEAEEGVGVLADVGEGGVVGVVGVVTGASARVDREEVADIVTAKTLGGLPSVLKTLPPCPLRIASLGQWEVRTTQRGWSPSHSDRAEGGSEGMQIEEEVGGAIVATRQPNKQQGVGQTLVPASPLRRVSV